jgi:mannose-6-phosphate isomerase-like protein (cupin superfamily)
MKSFHFNNLADVKAFRISPDSSNYFAILFDKPSAGIENIFVVEIFNVGGATPPNEHAIAHEFFYVLHGEGVARCNDDELKIKKGDSLLLHPGNDHAIHNTGSTRLYTLTVMTPNEGFSELIRSGDPVTLDAEDLRVLTGA